MTVYKKNKLLFLLSFALVMQITQCKSFADFDVVNATTIDSVTGEQILYPDTTFDDYDADVANEKKGNKFFSNVGKKVKNIFSRKDDRINESDFEFSEDGEFNDEMEEIPQEAIEEQIQPEFKPYQEKEVVRENYKFRINADEITYNDTDGNIYAKNNVEIIAKLQGVTLKADNAILYKEKQILKLLGNVRIIKDGTEMKGESLIVDLNEQNVLMNNPTYEAYSFVIHAQEGYLIANDIQVLNGTVSSTEKRSFPLSSKGFMRLEPTYKNQFFDKIMFEQNETDNEKEKTYRIDSKEIVLTSYKDHNSLLLKKSDVYFNNHKIIPNSDIEIISDKQRQIIETSLPEIGNLRNFGTYVGYGMLFNMPKGHIFKLMPVVAVSESNIGVGAIARYRARHGMVEGGWNTASTNAVVRGKYRFNNNFALTFGRNAYLPEGFLGSRRSGYAAQLQYQKSHALPDLGASFNNAVYIGLFSDYSKHDQEDAYSTTRFRYMAQLNKSVLKYKNEEQGYTVTLDAITQAAATVYGSGETHGIARIGPRITTRYKRWDSAIGYFITGEHGETPFVFDRYRYGKSTITLNERFHFNDKFSAGFRMFITPMRDNYKEDLLTECRFYFAFGPKDAKLALSYDFVRDVAHIDFMFLLGSDNAHLKFDKLTTQDIEGKVQKRDFYKNAKKVKIEKPENI